MRPIDLPPADLDTVRRILRDHAPGLETRAFGSRVSWTARETSDLDLVLMTETPLDAGRMAALRAALAGSDLPFRVDVADWAAVSEGFRAIIEREYVVLRRKTPAGPTRKTGRQMRKFGDCAELVRSTVSPASMEDTPYIGLEHIGEGTLSILGHGIVRDVKSPKYEFRSGDILFGKLRPYFRKVVRPNFDGVCSTDIWVVRARKNIDQVFLYYTMANPLFVDFATNASEGTKMPRAKWDWASRYEVRLPPLAEQRAIAEILGALDDKIELNRRMNETLEAMARAIFDDWFVDFGPVRAKMRGQESGLPKTLSRLFPGKLAESQIGPIPKGWKISRMDDIFEISSGKTLPVDMRYNDGTYRAFGANGPICKTEKSSVNSACVILGKIGSCGALHRSPSPCWVTNNAFAIREGKSGSLEYVWHTLKRIDFSKYVGGSGNPYMPLQNFGHHLVLLPPSRVCSAYQKIAGNLRERIDCNNFQSDILSAIRDALLPDLMSGRIPVSDFR